MQTAVVILNWNGEKFLQQFLPVLLKFTTNPETEIIVADNASTDSSVELLKNEFSTVRTIVLDKNYGFAGGYNKALAYIEADFYVLLNSDVEVTENWLDPIVSYMVNHEDVAACQPKILSYYNRTHFEYAGAAGGFIDRFGFPFCRGRVLGLAEEDKGQYNTVTDIFWATGACLVIRSAIFRKVGGFDDDFFAHMEEIDLCWRLKSRGFRIVCIPQSSVYHVGGGTLNAESPYKTYLNFRNNLLLLYKNLPAKLLKKILFWRILFDYIAALQLFISGKPKNSLSVIRARIQFKRMVPDFEDKRNENILYSTVENPNGILQESIVLNYYLKSKRIFSSYRFN